MRIKRFIKKLKLLWSIYKSLSTSINEYTAIKLSNEFLDIICLCANVPKHELLETKKLRYRKYVIPRQLHMAIRREVLKLSQEDSGVLYGKDHATVIHSIKAVKNLIETDKFFREQYKPVFKKCIEIEPMSLVTLNLKFTV